jgi:Ca2+/Na+ antiporter
MKIEIWETPLPILIISFILTWVIGLSVPVLIRYVFLRRPINKFPAIVIVVILYFIQLFIWIGLGSTNKSHAVLFLIAYVSYQILRKRNKGEYEVVKDEDDIDFEVKQNE